MTRSTLLVLTAVTLQTATAIELVGWSGGFTRGATSWTASARAQIARKPTQALAAAPVFTLEVRRASEETKGDVYVPAEWATQLAVPARDTLRFRFGPAKPTATDGAVAATAEWRVYAGPPPAFDIEGTAPNLLKRGAAGPIPQTGKVQEFDVNLQTVLPVKPDNKPYYVRIVGRDAQGKYLRADSPSVLIRYETSSWGTTLPDVPIVASVSQDKRNLTVVLRSSLNPPKTLGEIPPDLRIVLEPQKVSPASVWWAPGSAPVLRLKPSSIGSTANIFGGKPGKRLEALLPDVIVGGDYTLRVESSAIGYPSKRVATTLAWRVPPALYTIQYQGVRCLEETDGPGSDELGVYLDGGLNDVSALPFEEFDPQWPRQLIALHNGVDEDEVHPAAITLVEKKALQFVSEAVSPKQPARALSIMFELLEIDGSVSKKGHIKSGDYDFVGKGTLTITAEDLKRVGQTQGWHRSIVSVRGGPVGGRYSLRLGLRADPATK